MRQQRLEVIPVSLKEAGAFVAKHHRHNRPRAMARWAIGVVDEQGRLRGVLVAANPVARHRDDGRSLEAARVATDGCPNACSKLLAAAWRAARAMGFYRMGSYILESEPGTSLVAAGWRWTHTTKAGSSNWARHNRPGRADGPSGSKKHYEAPR
ncbi:MAG: XF1762 family protein [Acidimicrobiales bacterium]